MEKDYRLRKNYYFCLSFISKSKTRWQTNLNKNSILEQIFRLVEISLEITSSYAWQPLMCLVETSC